MQVPDANNLKSWIRIEKNLWDPQDRMPESDFASSFSTIEIVEFG
jgi:hypothetical protein